MQPEKGEREERDEETVRGCIHGMEDSWMEE